MTAADAFDPAPAAAMLAAAHRSGEVLVELPEAIRPRTLAEGYDIQDLLVTQLGLPVSGWKLGVGTPRQKEQSGIGRSIAGRILAPRVYEPGATIAVPDAPVTVELEIAYVLGRDIEPDDPPLSLDDAVAAVHVTFELVRSRFVDRRAVGWPSFAADNSAFSALVLGPAIDRQRIPELLDSLVVTADGVERARALSGLDATDPATALADLVATAAERQMRLPRGSIVSTGTASAPFDVAGGTASISARYLGVELGFTLERETRSAAMTGGSAHG